MMLCVEDWIEILGHNTQIHPRIEKTISDSVLKEISAWRKLNDVRYPCVIGDGQKQELQLNEMESFHI